jgi:hypothetical protein
MLNIIEDVSNSWQRSHLTISIKLKGISASIFPFHLIISRPFQVSFESLSPLSFSALHLSASPLHPLPLLILSAVITLDSHSCRICFLSDCCRESPTNAILITLDTEIADEYGGTDSVSSSSPNSGRIASAS